MSHPYWHRGLLHWGRAALASLSAREGLVKKLGRAAGNLPWSDVFELVCRESTDQFRAGDPVVQLQPAPANIERHLLSKLLVDHEINTIFADGGHGKSLLALTVALAVATKTTLPAGLVPKRGGPAFYLDWESCLDEHQERVAGLLKGLNLSAPGPIFYRRMAGALVDELPRIRVEVSRIQPALVIVDSLGPASGPEPEGTDATMRTLNALRTLPMAKLVVTHVSKGQADQRGPARPFGSVYVMNLSRNVWELRRAQEDAEGKLTLGAYHRKANRGGMLAPFSVQFTFMEGRITLTAAEVSEDAALREKAGLRHSVRSALRAGARIVPELAEELDAKEDSLRKTLRRLEADGVVIQAGKRMHQGKPCTEWGLKAC